MRKSLLNNFITKTLITVFLLFNVTISAVAQKEETVPLKSNYTISKNLQTHTLMRSGEADYDTLNLEKPFFDDFSWSNIYPDDSLWIDKKVFINNHMALYPISCGVATFDGLNSNGMPYNPGVINSKGKIADELTSVPFDFSNYSSSDNIFLSFFYQAQGIGDMPEPYDSLVLEIKPDRYWAGSVWDSTKWIRIWSTAGTKVKAFEQVSLKVPEFIIDTTAIIDTIARFYHDVFQFRFRNYASLAGNLDHWHLDYVYMAKGRDTNDLYYEDVAIVYEPKSLLNDYTSMPWSHLIADKNQLRSSMEMSVRNNYYQTRKAQGGYEIIDTFDNDQIMFDDNANSQDVYTFLTFPLTDSMQHNFLYNDVSNFDTFALEVKLENHNYSTDIRSKNNVCSKYQVFSNYYAYDDETPEMGYGITAANYSRVAYRFKMADNYPSTDSLRGMAIFFNQSNEERSNRDFTLMVWNDYTNEPIYFKDTITPQFNNNKDNGYYIYEFDTVLSMDGEFYIGWEQYEDYFMNVGLDMNYYQLKSDSIPSQANSNIHYYVQGKWLNSSVAGAIMMRPIFSDKSIINSIKQKKQKTFEFTVYPNPAKNEFYIKSRDIKDKQLSLFDISGKLVLSKKLDATGRVNVENLDKGFYIIRLIDEKKNIISNSKIIIQ